jgi:hypothetical protein
MKKDMVWDRDAYKYELINLDTGEVLVDAVIADDETGEYLQYVRDEKGELVIITDKKGHLSLEKQSFKGNIKFVAKGEYIA